MTPYTLYGAEISYYTGKVRAFLQWKGLPFVEVPATGDVYRQVILPRIGFAVIPVLETPEAATLQDSTDIIEALDRQHGEPSVFPCGGVQRLASALLELYGDEWLLIPAMHYRWHHNREWALRAFGALNAPEASPEEQLELGTRRAAPFSQAAVLLGAMPHMHSAIERSYEDLLAELNAHFAEHPYLLGARPSIGDFGLYGPLYAHQYRDPASGALMRRLAPHVVAWVERMQQPPTPRSGDFLSDDTLPPTLLPVLRRMMREQMPVLEDTARRLNAWLAENPGTPVPRTLGKHGFTLEGEHGERIVRPYALWMLQRARDIYRTLTPLERAQADRYLDAIGGQALRNFPDPPRLVRDGMSVALDPAQPLGK